MNDRFKHGRRIGAKQKMQLFGIDPSGDVPFFVKQGKEFKHLILMPFRQVMKEVLVRRPLRFCQKQTVFLHIWVDQIPHHIDLRILPKIHFV